MESKPALVNTLKEIPLEKCVPKPPTPSPQESAVTPDSSQQNSEIETKTNFDFSTYVKSPPFQDQMKKVRLQVSDSTFDKIAKNPQYIKDWIMQVISKFPDILDDNLGTILQYISAPEGQVQINQPDQ